MRPDAALLAVLYGAGPRRAEGVAQNRSPLAPHSEKVLRMAMYC
ncbi:MAG TPA: hypothetical protein VFX49_17585 [Chloroflexota bacterium]|nr:hypothetical protein [Chloroflexota bacterium]